MLLSVHDCGREEVAKKLRCEERGVYCQGCSPDVFTSAHYFKGYCKAMFNLGDIQRAELVLEQARVFRSEPKLEQVPFHIKLTLLSQSALRVDPKVGAIGRRAVPS